MEWGPTSMNSRYSSPCRHSLKDTADILETEIHQIKEETCAFRDWVGRDIAYFLTPQKCRQTSLEHFY